MTTQTEPSKKTSLVDRLLAKKGPAVLTDVERVELHAAFSDIAHSNLRLTRSGSTVSQKRSGGTVLKLFTPRAMTAAWVTTYGTRRTPRMLQLNHPHRPALGRKGQQNRWGPLRVSTIVDALPMA